MALPYPEREQETIHPLTYIKEVLRHKPVTQEDIAGVLNVATPYLAKWVLAQDEEVLQQKCVVDQCPYYVHGVLGSETSKTILFRSKDDPNHELEIFASDGEEGYSVGIIDKRVFPGQYITGSPFAYFQPEELSPDVPYDGGAIIQDNHCVKIIKRYPLVRKDPIFTLRMVQNPYRWPFSVCWQVRNEPERGLFSKKTLDEPGVLVKPQHARRYVQEVKKALERFEVLMVL